MSEHTPEHLVEEAEEVAAKVADTVSEIRAATQVQHPWRAVARTLVQVGVPTFLALAVFLPDLVSALPGLGLPADFVAKIMPVMLAISAAITLAAGVLAKVMANPTINSLLTKFGLSAAPAATDTADATEPNDTGVEEAEEENFDIEDDSEVVAG